MDKDLRMLVCGNKRAGERVISRFSGLCYIGRNEPSLSVKPRLGSAPFFGKLIEMLMIIVFHCRASIIFYTKTPCVAPRLTMSLVCGSSNGASKTRVRREATLFPSTYCGSSRVAMLPYLRIVPTLFGRGVVSVAE